MPSLFIGSNANPSALICFEETVVAIMGILREANGTKNQSLPNQFSVSNLVV